MGMALVSVRLPREAGVPVAGDLAHPVPVGAAPPLGRGFRGASCHHLGLASPVGLAEMGLHRTPPTRTSLHHRSDQKTGDSPDNRKSHLGTQARARRTHPTRPLHRRLHVWQILHNAGIDPAPRRSGPT